ncbi:uroporphyrinogen-III synthase-like [Copidosoma floridanum]|uniref:uroporphyrinogen-III synthase-like n=1 Tax=Copidosoma floridanum TaxID=29053 RepID=UPI0006C9765F|nr:uroporphyrinogen-III synthase-like [Copidosoma floridanum]
MTNVTKNIILCTSSSSETDSKESHYKTCLSEINVDCKVLEVLDFEFVNLDELKSRLLDSDSYSGLILTSPRTVIALNLVKTNNQSSFEPWEEKLSFCIGPSTEMIAKKQLGLKNVLGTESGNAKNLANFIIKTMTNYLDKPLLLPCSEIAKNTIPKMLSDAGMIVEKLVVYKTKAKDGLEEALHKTLGKLPDVLVFFSPSVVETMINVLQNAKHVLEKSKIIAIGPVTNEALLNARIRVDGVSEKPEPEALVKVIKTVM